MNYFNPQSDILPRVLATDLDGTLIPLPNRQENIVAMELVSEARDRMGFGLVYATGRHFESVLAAIRDYRMPEPDWIVCDVGSSIYKRKETGYDAFASYEDHIAGVSKGIGRTAIEALLRPVKGLKLQRQDHQKRFKISYESASSRVDDLVGTINELLGSGGLPFGCMGSIDPFIDRGLIDVLPKGVSKAFAILWLSKHGDFRPDEVVFSGDSGNDYAALVSGFRAIIVENASDGLADRVREALATRQLEERLYVANEKATSGVLEGCLHFRLID